MAGWLTSIKRTIQRRVRALGYDISEYVEQSTLGSHLETLFARRAIDCVLDVGAHHGEYGRYLRRMGYTGAIVSLEPVAASFARLQEHCAGDPAWRAHHLALGAQKGAQPISVSTGTTFSSFLSPTSYAFQQFPRSTAVRGTEVVDVRRLDQVLEELVTHLREPRIFLKLDTQGYDMNVIEGAQSCLDRILALQTELSVKAVYQGAMGMGEALARLNDLGFELTGIFPVTRDSDGLRVIEFDAVMVRSTAGSHER